MNRSFQERVDHIARDRSVSRSPIIYYTLDSKIIAKSRNNTLPAFPWRQMVAALLLLVIAKAGMFHAMGEGRYRAEVMAIGKTNVVERSVSFVLQADPATVAIARTLRAVGVPQLG